MTDDPTTSHARSRRATRGRRPRARCGAARRSAAAGIGLLLALAACSGGGATSGPVGPTGPTGPTEPVVPTVPTTPTDPAAWISIASEPAGAGSVEILSDRTLGTGLQLLALRVRDPGGGTLAGADVSFAAELAAGGGTHRATGLAAPAPATDGTYRVEVVLPAASPPVPGWAATVGVTRPGEAEEQASFTGLPVVERGLAVPFGAGAATFLLAVRFEAPLQAGFNPITVALLETADGGATWAPAAGADFAVEPWMTSMGHGSLGSVAPVAAGPPGRYRGTLAFSMVGDWATTFTVARQGIELGRPVVYVEF
jgi:hypothetical protein